ncbi:MAG: hypothetical protein Q4D55_10045 [Eubacteriales bacterium]|nr:hypothetical protein [Eubacteriales bacterium]
MKNLKQFFHVIMTAVICFWVSIRSKKEGKNQLTAALSGAGCCGETRGMSGCSDDAEASGEGADAGRTRKSIDSSKRKGWKLGRYQVFRRLNGPGDRPRTDEQWKKAG